MSILKDYPVNKCQTNLLSQAFYNTASTTVTSLFPHSPMSAVQTVHLFFLSVWWMWVGDSDRNPDPPQKTFSQQHPTFLVKHCARVLRKLNQQLGPWNQDVKWWRSSTALHPVDDQFHSWTHTWTRGVPLNIDTIHVKLYQQLSV